MMFHYLYRTTCLVNDKYYIGVHSTANLFDGYLGSGLRLSCSVKAHGDFNHDRVFLEFFDTREEAFAREVEIVNLELLKDPQCMNLKPGGSGGWGTSEDQSKRGIIGNAKMKFLRETDEVWVENFRDVSSNAQKLAYENGKAIPGMCGPQLQEMQKRSNTPKARAKRKATFEKIDHQQGSKNSQYRTCWVSNNVHTIKISIELLEEHISKGYVRGRKLVIK